MAAVFLVLSLLPFYLMFDRRKAQARDLVPIALMAAMCVVGRTAFSIVPLPNFKPVTAIVMITGIAFGPEAGYLTGALAALLSNFLFGQGPLSLIHISRKKFFMRIRRIPSVFP